MKSRIALHHVALALLCAITAADRPEQILPPAEGRDIPDIPDLTAADSDAEESRDNKMIAAADGEEESAPMHGGGGGHGGNGKFFQYGHHDGKDHYETGFRRGNEHHFQERHEKGAPKHGHYTGKVRWGDKHGGYGEHYWDYNHGGHSDGGADGGGGGDSGGDGSSRITDFADHNDHGPRSQFKRHSGLSSDQSSAASSTGEASVTASPGRSRAYRKKYMRPSTSTVAPTHPVPTIRTTPKPPAYRQPPPPPTVSPPLAPAAAASKTKKAAFFGSADFPAGGMFHQAALAAGLTPRTARETVGKIHQGHPGQGRANALSGLVRRLAFDPRTGRVHDEDTGQVFVLQPVS